MAIRKQGRMAECFITQENLSDLDRLKVAYGLELIKNEGFKTIVFLFVFLLMGKVHEFLLCMAISCTVRIFSGGIHMKTNFGCFAASSILLSFQILILPNVDWADCIYFILLWISLGIICTLAPIPSYKRPIKGRQKYVRCKTLTILFSILWGILLPFVFHEALFIRCGIWTLILQAIQMTLQYANRYFHSDPPVMVEEKEVSHV